MGVADLERLYAYGWWANCRLFDVLGALTPDQFTATVAGGHGSVRNTLVHVLSAEWGWLERCGGPRRGERLRAEDYDSVDTLAARWAQVEGYTRGFLAGLTEADLAREIAFTFGGGPEGTAPLGDLLLHGGLHAVHHRGQVALLLRMLGYAPGTFDFLIYASGPSDQGEGRLVAAGGPGPPTT